MIDKKRSIGVAAKEVGVQEHVIRFWESQFPETIKPTIGVGGRRYYYNKDIETLLEIKRYLYEEGYTIKGLQGLLRSQNINQNMVDDGVNIENCLSLQMINDKQQPMYSQKYPNKQVNSNYISKNNFNNEMMSQYQGILGKNKLNTKLLKENLFQFRERLTNFLIKLENM